MERTVTVIPQRLQQYTGILLNENKVQKRKVAAYARVSTDSEEQKTSYEAQVKHYTDYIQSRSDWSFVKVYTDSGIRGLDARHRDGFKQMIKDAINGDINLIIFDKENESK